MNPMNDQRFFDLAMKNIARQATDAERAELDALVSAQPELREEFERLKAEARLAKEILPLAAATERTAGEFPAYARERLRTKVRQTLGEPQRATASASKAKWRWISGFAGAATVALFLVLTQSPRSTTLVVEVAMLDSTGATRGTETNEVVLLKQQWNQSSARLFEKPDDLKVWEHSWSNDTAPRVKVIYDRTAGEVRVAGRSQRGSYERTILVEKDLASALAEAAKFIHQQTQP